MIDINELRQSLGAIQTEEVAELLDRLEVAEKELDNYKFAFSEYSEKTEWMQQGINDGTVSPKYLGWHRVDVMADMLKSAESECLEQARLNGMGASREAALMAKLEAAEKERYAESIAMYRKARDERDALRAKVSDLMINVAFLDNLKKSYEELIEELQEERDELRAKIEAMEQQEPVAWIVRGGYPVPLDKLEWQLWYGSEKPTLSWVNQEMRPLYALPGAKGE